MAERRPRLRYLPVRVHLTVAGWLFLFVATLVGLAAVRTGASLALAMFGGMLGAVVFSAVAAWDTLRAVRLEREVPGRVWQNRTAHLSYFLRNRRRWGGVLGLQAREQGLRDVDFADAYGVHLAGGQAFRAGARFVPRRRGRIVFARTRLSTTFPFGLVRAVRLVLHAAEVIAWPARGRLKRQLLYHGAAESSSAAAAPVQGGQDEFFGLREYRAGDNPRWIHWRRSASRPRPVVREMSRPLPDALWVVLDARPEEPAAGARTLERMIRFAATLIDHAFSKDYKVGLALATAAGAVAVAPAPGLGQRCKLLDLLATLDAAADAPPQPIQPLRPARRLRDAMAVLVTPDPRRPGPPGLANLRAACRHVLTVGPGDLETVFEDDPLAREEGA